LIREEDGAYRYLRREKGVLIDSWEGKKMVLIDIWGKKEGDTYRYLRKWRRCVYRYLIWEEGGVYRCNTRVGPLKSMGI
jgi:hypothetical protein